MHKVAAGNGYEYYLRNTAANDTTARGRASLSDYYNEHGEAAGTWHGSGLSDLEITPGEEVTEEQMKFLFGAGMHPNADQVREHVRAHHLAAGVRPAYAARLAEKATKLGNRYAVYSTTSGFPAATAQAYRDYNTSQGECVTAHIPDPVRAQIRTEVATEMFTTEYERAPLDARELSGWVAKNSRPDRTAVAGFDFTFSPVKSVSALWAIATPELAHMIETAHRAAITDALSWLENNALFTRLGRNGIRHVDVQGAIAATFDHRDSRAGDPDLHTHVLVANRVRTEDGKWRTVNGTVVHEAVVTVSEIYDTRLEHYLETALGVRFETRPDRNIHQVRVREIVGVPLMLIHHWSRRTAVIVSRLDTLTAAFQTTFGREPTPSEVHDLGQRATLETRPRKHAPGSRTEQRASWRADAETLLGGPDAVDDIFVRALAAPHVSRRELDHAFITHLADQALAAVSDKRATWRLFNLRAEVERQIRGNVAPAEWAEATEKVLAQALSPSSSVARGDPDVTEEPDLRAVPAWLRRRDGTPVHARPNSQIYTTESMLAAEAELIALSVEPGGLILNAGLVSRAVYDYNIAHPDRPLNPGQIRVIESFASAGMRVHTANAPAGTGKTTAIQVLATAWESGGGTVLGMAPTAAAASVLGESIGTRAETVDKLLHVIDAHRPDNSSENLSFLPQWVLDIDETTLVIVDEHVTLPTTKRLQLLRYLAGRGATVRCIGDDRQLLAIDAGGVHADMTHAAPGQASTLTEVVRFAQRGEALASIGLREGDPLALAWYLDNGRIHAGHLGTVYEDAYQAWAADITNGSDAVMLAPTHDIVTALNVRARAHRIARSDPPTGTAADPHVFLADGLVASAGDTVRTRRNDPRLRVGARDWVRNGYSWSIRQVHSDDSVTVVRRVHGRDTDAVVRLPGDYVHDHLHMGYAATIDSAQGITADSCHVAMSGRESRQQFYVAMTRGRQANHAYIATALDGDEGDIYTLPAHYPRTAVEHLHHVLDRDGARASAHTELRDSLDPARRIGRAVDIYLDTLGMTAENAIGTTRLDTIDRVAEQLVPGLTDSPAYSVLRQHLAMLALSGADPVTELRTAIAARELDTVTDPAAVLDWRLDNTGNHSAGPGPLAWTPGLPTGIPATGPDTAPVQAWERIVAELARQVSDTARAWTTATAPKWARPLLGTDPELVADLAVWRAGLRVPESDPRPTGPARHTAVEHAHQQQLHRRIFEVDGNTRLPQHRWAATVDRIDPRISADPTWPIIATNIDATARAGLDIEHQLTDAAGARPLPDEMPAAALWARLEIDDTDIIEPEPDHTTEQHRLTEPLPAAGAREHGDEPDSIGSAIASAIDAATPGGYSEYAGEDDGIEEFDPYGHRERDAGHGFDC